MLIIFSLLFNVSVFAASNFELAAAASTESYRTDFQSENGRSAPEPYGYFLERETAEILSTVFFDENRKMTASTYGCHDHRPGEFDCHKEDKRTLGAYSRTTAIYNAEEMKKSIPLAIDFFSKSVAPESSIISLKLWEAHSNIRYVVEYLKGTTKTRYFLACHYHDGEMDCHHKRDAGPGEPTL